MALGGDLLGDEKPRGKDVKYNIFKFQDHILEWIYSSAHYFLEKNYCSAFEALSIVYFDTLGFFDDEEQKDITKKYEEALKANNSYIMYNIDWMEVSRKVKTQTYQPPVNIYKTLVDFRKNLMLLMAKHNMLMLQVKKGESGAASQI